MLVPYLNNSFEETIFGSNNIKEKYETMKLKTENVDYQWIGADHQSVHKWETS